MEENKIIGLIGVILFVCLGGGCFKKARVLSSQYLQFQNARLFI